MPKGLMTQHKSGGRYYGAAPWEIKTLPTRVKSLWDCEPGDRILIQCSQGGLGDFMMTTVVLAEFARQYPDFAIEYALPSEYQCLFQAGNGKGFAIRSLTNEYDDYDWAIELDAAGNNYDGTLHRFPGMKPRNKMDIMAEWIGFKLPEYPVSCFKLTRKELEKGQELLGEKETRQIIFAPFASTQMKSYPFYLEVGKHLENEGFHVWYINKYDIERPNTFINLPYRDIGAVIACADLVISVDTAILHFAGILDTPTIALFNLTHGEVFCKYYPTAIPLQFCATPCLGFSFGECHKKKENSCFPVESISKIMDQVRNRFSV